MHLFAGCLLPKRKKKKKKTIQRFKIVAPTLDVDGGGGGGGGRKPGRKYFVVGGDEGGGVVKTRSSGSDAGVVNSESAAPRGAAEQTAVWWAKGGGHRRAYDCQHSRLLWGRGGVVTTSSSTVTCLHRHRPSPSLVRRSCDGTKSLEQWRRGAKCGWVGGVKNILEQRGRREQRSRVPLSVCVAPAVAVAVVASPSVRSSLPDYVSQGHLWNNAFMAAAVAAAAYPRLRRQCSGRGRPAKTILFPRFVGSVSHLTLLAELLLNLRIAGREF